MRAVLPVCEFDANSAAEGIKTLKATARTGTRSAAPGATSRATTSPPTAPTGFGLHRRAQPVDLVDLAHELGLGVVETRLTSNDADAVKTLRAKVEGYGMRVILDTPLPRSESDVERFDAAVKAAESGCPVSKLFKTEITVSSQLVTSKSA